MGATCLGGGGHRKESMLQYTSTIIVQNIHIYTPIHTHTHKTDTHTHLHTHSHTH